MGADRAQARTIVRSRRSCMGMVYYMLSNACLAIRFSPAIRISLANRFINRLLAFVNNNKYWLSFNLYGIWIREHKGATTLQKLGGNSGEVRIRGVKRLRFEGGAQIEGEARKSEGEVRGGGSVRNFWNFELKIVTSGGWWIGGKGNLVQKWESIKIGGS